jgi:hypothetical protein
MDMMGIVWLEESEIDDKMRYEASLKVIEELLGRLRCLRNEITSIAYFYSMSGGDIRHSLKELLSSHFRETRKDK